jgi:DNA excision repair protein ERCC-3
MGYLRAVQASSVERAAVVQGDRSVLVEVEHPAYEEARALLVRCAELEKSPEHIHTYRLSDLSLWNAASTGLTADAVVAGLRSISRFKPASHLEHEVRDRMERWGQCVLEDVAEDGGVFRLRVSSSALLHRLAASKKLAPLLDVEGDVAYVEAKDRGRVKQVLLGLGWPTDDRAGHVPGAPLDVRTLRSRFTPYAYQQRAVEAFQQAGSHGVVVLPCGAGKTVVALLAMEALATRTLIIGSSREACLQWRREILAKTTLSEPEVRIYGAERKEIGPVTLTTYSMLGKKGGSGPVGHAHFERLAAEPWGLVVYDEVHLLPAPVFRLTAELQARRRLGLTATLVREDGREGDVFALIGPKRYDVPWRELEMSGHIAQATCFDVRVPLPEGLSQRYALAASHEQARIAAENPYKLEALRRIAARHVGDRLLVLGSHLDGLRAAASLLGVPCVTGEMPATMRDEHYQAFRSGQVRTLALSRVGNFAIDLPEANVLVQLSGTSGSRQEEAQRLGRVLRPKPGGASFYSLVTRDTVEESYAFHRQSFLTEQGYRYQIEDMTFEGVVDGAGSH